MNKKQYLFELKKVLKNQKKEDLKKTIKYYDLMIDDYIKGGMAEEEAVASLDTPIEVYEKLNLVNPSVIVDTNHNNSGKQYLEQVRIAKDVVHSRNQNADIKKLVKGLMIESYLEDGAQCAGEGVFGKSITDPCLGWSKTEQLILDIAEKL